MHVYIISVLLAFGPGGAEALGSHFDLSLGANPNLLTYGPFYGLCSLFGLATAEKLVMSGFVVGLPLAVFYAARGCGRDPWLCLWLAVPFAFCMPLQFEIMLRIHYYICCFIAHTLQEISKHCVSSPHSAKARQTASLIRAGRQAFRALVFEAQAMQQRHATRMAVNHAPSRRDIGRHLAAVAH